MNIITGTTQQLTDSLKHYLCMRLQFRSTVVSGAGGRGGCDKRFREYCPATRH